MCTYERFKTLFKEQMDATTKGCVVCVSHGDSMTPLHDIWKNDIEKDSAKYLLLEVSYANVTILGRKNN